MLTTNYEKTKLKKFGRTSRRQYITKNYANPYFYQRKNAIDIKRLAKPILGKIKIIILSFIVILISLIWFLFYSPYFAIKTIDIQSVGQVDIEEIRELAWQQTKNNFFIFIPQKNIFFFNKNSLAEQIKKQFPINELKISKKLPSTILINYNEKKQALFWSENEKYYQVDAKGSLISEINLQDIKKDDYPIIFNLSDKKINGAVVTVEQKYLLYAIELFAKFKSFENEFTVDKFQIDNDIDTIKVNLVNNPQIYFSINEDADKQINKLLSVKYSKLKKDFNQKNYIDLRSGNTIFIH